MTKQEELKKAFESLSFKKEEEYMAALNSHPELMTFQTEKGENIFLAACISGHFNVAYHLIETGFNIHQKTTEGRNAIFYATLSSILSNESPLDIIKTLHHLHIPLDEKDIDNNSPLLLAARCSSFDVIQFLMENGADINQENEEGHSFLQITNTYHHEKDIPFLLKYLDQFNEKNQKILKKWRLKYLVEKGSV